MWDFVSTTWTDVKGNAKWDIIKWLLGGSVIATGYALFRAASLYWRVQILIFVVSVLCFAAVSVYQRVCSRKKLEVYDRSNHPNLECDELYADTLFDWLRKHIHGTGTFSAASLAQSVGLPEDAVNCGLGLLRSKYQIVSQRSPGVDAWSFVAGVSPFVPKYKIVSLGTSETLAERTLKLRREIEDFVIGVGQKPKPEFGANDSTLDVIKKSREAVGPWYEKITFGYKRLYAERVRQIFLEFGELGLLPMGFQSDINQAQSVEEGIKQVIARLGTLVEHALQATQRSA